MSVVEILLNLFDSLPWREIPELGAKLAALAMIVAIIIVGIMWLVSIVSGIFPDKWFSNLFIKSMQAFVNYRARTSVTSRFIGLWTPTLDPIWIEIGDVKAFLTPPSHRDKSKWEIQVQMKEISVQQDNKEMKAYPHYLGSDKIFDTKEEAQNYLTDMLSGASDDCIIFDL